MEPVSKKVKLGSGTSDDKQIDPEEDEKQESLPVVLNYDELRTVFKFMKAIDVLRAAQVCKSWKVAAYDEVESRQYPEYIVEQFQSVGSSRRKQICNKQKVKKVHLLAIDLSIKPHLGFIFMRTNVHKKKGVTTWDPNLYFFNGLPSSCTPLMISSAYDIVANHEDTNEKNTVVATFLPKIPNLSVDRHNISFTEGHINIKKEKALLKKFFEDSVWNCNQQSKCVILLTTGEACELSKYATEYFQSMYKPGTVALWGGVAANLTNCSSKQYAACSNVVPPCLTPIVCGVLCISSPSLQSWSIVLPESCTSKSEMEKRLRAFKENIQLKKYSLALMCACVAREGNTHTEIRTFKEVFPGIDLVGFLGDGEYGLDTLNKERDKNLELSYSTVFLILTYE
ncbi:uncharacterized protein LOC106644308 [Copidosoma floridanum]|uniref:uncharacterized protein LOC106644308 n=1 Tax=Copidosoma floridanum TaxID=29053 RepID=UPI0006C9777D|nr:uncharacterized protein LOC106644308 [Copidosoma floridanum]XP_014215238.1 uncharacterized protein LOC106644308 [Copidosoma floridanum]